MELMVWGQSNMINELQIETDFFEQHRKEWCKHHTGKIAVIYKTTLHGFYDTYETALEVGYDKCGIVAFLIKEVRLEDEISFMPLHITLE